MRVRVIPIQPGTLVSRDGDLVIERLARPQVNEDIVRSTQRRNFQPVVMQVGRGVERVDEFELNLVPRTCPECRWDVEAVVAPGHNILVSDPDPRLPGRQRGAQHTAGADDLWRVNKGFRGRRPTPTGLTRTRLGEIATAHKDTERAGKRQ